MKAGCRYGDLARRGWEQVSCCLKLHHNRHYEYSYFFLADFAPHDASHLAEQLKDRGILMKPLNDPMLGNGYMRVTTALPEDNARFMTVVRDLLTVEEKRN